LISAIGGGVKQTLSADDLANFKRNILNVSGGADGVYNQLYLRILGGSGGANEIMLPDKESGMVPFYTASGSNS
jgi:hypothetical protein